MKRFFQTIKNIFKIEELRKRLGYTFLLLLVYRLGSFIVVPGIDPTMLQNLEAQASTGLLSLLDMFSGGAFGNASIFALGVMPYISASIVIQLLGVMVPYFQKMQREGESGRRKMNQWTRYLTIVILLLQGPAYITNLHAQLPPEAFLVQGFGFNIFATIVLMAGTMFVMWLGERITDRGIGNGISLIIMVGIIARLPFALFAEAAQRFSQTNGGPLMFLIEIVILFLVFIATIALVQGQRKVPVQYAKRVVGNRQYGGVRQYIPLKINAAGVMPIIFAQALMMSENKRGRRNADYFRPGTDDVPAPPLAFRRLTGTCGYIERLYRILVQLHLCYPRSGLHLLLHSSNSEPYHDGGGNEEERRIHSRSEARKEDSRLPRCNHVAYHSARIPFPGYRGDTSGICDDVRDKQPVLAVLRRNLAAYPCRRSARYPAADRIASAHEALRRFDEDRTS